MTDLEKRLDHMMRATSFGEGALWLSRRLEKQIAHEPTRVALADALNGLLSAADSHATEQQQRLDARLANAKVIDGTAAGPMPKVVMR